MLIFLLRILHNLMETCFTLYSNSFLFQFRTLPLETTKHNNSFNNSDSDGQAKFPCSYMDLISNRRTRIQFSSTFLVELSYSVYFALFNNVIEPALEALDLIHERALYSMYPDVLLVSIRSIFRSISQCDRTLFSIKSSNIST